jgi:hypothetical protein
LSTFPDKLFELGGAPVGGGRYEGMWEGNAHFVDYDNGASGSGGPSVNSPGKYLQDAIDKSGPWDVIYIRPRDPAYEDGGGANYHLPASTSNWSIPYTSYGLSLIGTSPQPGRNAGMMSYLRGGAVTTDAPVLLIKSCWNNVENLGFHAGASLQAQIMSKRGSTAAVGRAYGNTYNNCTFRFGAPLIADHLQGGIHIDSSSYEGIYNCTFTAAPVGIVIRSIQGSVQHTQIHGCHFHGTAAEVSCDIFASGTNTNLSIKDCTFAHAVGSLATVVVYGKYVYIGAASTGLISNCVTAAADPTIADNMTLDGVLYSNIQIQEELEMVVE